MRPKGGGAPSSDRANQVAPGRQLMAVSVRVLVAPFPVIALLRFGGTLPLMVPDMLLIPVPLIGLLFPIVPLVIVLVFAIVIPFRMVIGPQAERRHQGGA